ncbi:MAG TPA: FixH family protein [Candidatus Acidoferrum sp.]|nr:FixH family protein [Candidatus Acidoferrum sp.]
MTLATRMTEQQPKPRRSLWPIAIISYFVVFIAAMVVWIVYASRQRMDLVNKDYYAQEILFQQQIDASGRARTAGNVGITYDYAKQLITIQLPDAVNISSGAIHFYRPNDAKLDHDVRLALSTAGSQQLDARSLRTGLWKVRITWKSGGEDHYADKSIVVAQHES